VSDGAYISVVATSRNDDHGGNMLRRMQIFVNGWIEQCRRHDLASELILVEWNPPPGRASLSEVLRWPADPGPCEVRIVTVPEAIHRRYRHSESLPLFQMIAKNVGIRRARAPFVVATNVDILFNDEFFSFLARKRLEKGRFYRIDRSDAMSEVPLEADVVEQLEYCRTHLLRVNQREATFSPPDPRPTADPSNQAGVGFRVGAGLGIDRRSTGEVYLSACSEATLYVKPPAPGPRVLRMLVEVGPRLRRDTFTFHVHDQAGHRLAAVPFRSQERLFVPLPDVREDEIALRLSVERAARRRAAEPPVHFRLFEWGWASPEELRGELATQDGQAPREPRAVPARDVYEYVEGVSLLEGWGGREFTGDGRPYRRVASGARFSSYAATRIPGRLVLDLELEPGSALELRITDDSGRVAAQRKLVGGVRVQIPVLEKQSAGRTTYVLGLADDAGATPTPARGVRVHGLRRAGVGPSLRRLMRPLARPRVDFVHTNGCGDFTLMHRDHWFRLRGYPEWEAYSMNIDGFTCYAAHADGLQEVVLRDPMRIYHVEHGLGSGWSPEGEKKLYERITSRGITWIGKEQVLEQARRMYERGPLICNDDGWGLGAVKLPESTPVPGAAGEKAVPVPTTREERRD
jgi:hypothetical protein